jgi:hypothetical protein
MSVLALDAALPQHHPNEQKQMRFKEEQGETKLLQQHFTRHGN